MTFCALSHSFAWCGLSQNILHKRDSDVVDGHVEALGVMMARLKLVHVYITNIKISASKLTHSSYDDKINFVYSLSIFFRNFFDDFSKLICVLQTNGAL